MEGKGETEREGKGKEREWDSGEEGRVRGSGNLPYEGDGGIDAPDRAAERRVRRPCKSATRTSSQSHALPRRTAIVLT